MDKPTIRIAILDLYNRVQNEGMRGIRSLLYVESKRTDARLRWDIYEVRNSEQLPGLDYDIYISSGGPGSPLETGEPWEKKYFALVDQLWKHNQIHPDRKKHVFFICHSFQLICRHWKVGEVTKRYSPAFGVFPIHKTEDGLQEPLFMNLPDPFYAVDSREYQVVNPDHAMMEQEGFSILAIEKMRPHIELERAVMAIRFSDEWIGTQFHPEADPEGMIRYFCRPEKKEHIIKTYGEAKYYQMIDYLDDDDKIILTQQYVLPGFLRNAFSKILETADCV